MDKTLTIGASGKSSKGASNNSLAQNTGATVSPTYHDSPIGVVGVNVEDLRDFSASSKEELGQLAIGQFFWSRSFWLGLEKLITDSYQNSLFQICVVVFLCGMAVSFSGFRQLKRRKTRIEKLIDNAKKKDV